MSQIKTVNIICSHYFPHSGGVERFALLQARVFSNLGFAVNVITHDTEGRGFYEQAGNIKIYRLKCLSPIKDMRMPVPVLPGELFKVFRNCFRLKQAICILHTRYFSLCLIGAIFARIAGQKLILLDHSSDYITLGGKLVNCLCHVYEHLMTSALKLFRPTVFGVSKACTVWLRRFGIEGRGVYYNGLDFSQSTVDELDVRRLYEIDDKKIVLLVGRLLRAKGALELVQGFKLFNRTNPGYVLIIVGAGELSGELARLAHGDQSFFFAGKRTSEEVFSIMAQADIFVNPSNYPEGLPTVLLEAGRSGLAVISTPNGGAAEIIKNRETGLLIDRGEPEQIAEALRFLADSPALRAKLAGNLQRLIQEAFDFFKITKAFLKGEFQEETQWID